MIKGIDIAGYVVNDPGRVVAFYRDVLGMTPTELDANGRGAEFTLADGSTFGIWNPGSEVPSPKGFVMLAVDDAKAAVEAFRARGAILSDVDETPVCFMAFGADPEGNQVIIHQRKGT